MDKNTLIQLAKDVYQLSLLFPNKEPLRYRMRAAADDIVEVWIMKQNDYLHTLKLHLETIDSFFEIASCQDWTSPLRVNSIRDKYRTVASQLGPVKAPTEFAILEAIAATSPIQIIEENFTEPEISPVPGAPIVDGGIICPPPVAKPISSHPMIRPEIQVIPVEEPKTSENGDNLAQEEALEAAVVQSATKLDNIIPSIDLASEDGEGDEGDEGGVGLTSGQILRQNRILTFLKEKGGAQVWEIQKIFPDISKRTIRRDFRSMLKQGLIERFGERNTTFYKLKINIS